jgi:quercetin dioxygenase-like cupin family protein
MRSSINAFEAIAGVAAGWKVLGEVGSVDTVKVARVHGANPWHVHADFDESYFVLEGVFCLDHDAGTIELKAGDFFVMPRGTRHRGRSDAGATLLRLDKA